MYSASKKHCAKNVTTSEIPIPQEYENDSDFVRAISVQKSWLVIRQFWAQLAKSENFSPEDLCNDITEKNQFLRDENGNLVLYPLSPKKELWMEHDLNNADLSFGLEN